jgi:hypothetical protein
MFKKGMRVRAILHGAGVVTEEECIVLRVDRDGVWLDNGVGNDPSGPFIDGKMQGVFGFWEEIIPLAAKEKKPRICDDIHCMDDKEHLSHE